MWWRALVGESAGGAAQSVAQVAESWLPGAGVGPREVGSAGAPAGGLSVEWIVWRIGFSSFWSGYRVRYELGSGDAMSGRGRRVQAVLAWAECDAKFFPREAAGRLETRSMEGEEARDKRHCRGSREQVVVVSPVVQSIKPQQEIPGMAAGLCRDGKGIGRILPVVNSTGCSILEHDCFITPEDTGWSGIRSGASERIGSAMVVGEKSLVFMAGQEA
ncbi:hypothetical protein AALP_AAs58272U000100 [Arabis alpina]|uniref:Uncharacterized protein n=1 Tax=Arabis alpina TaxID=50452 RepID=A0A087G140_ARAAL|nr:hypothetical protein AALP_AAs58272U000100 [Arabis alpina]